MQVVSKFRTAYWLWQFVSYAGGLFIIWFCVYYSIEEGRLDYQNGFFWIACMAALALVYQTMNLLFTVLKRLTITEEGIELYYLVTKQYDLIEYEQIADFRTQLITSRQGAGKTAGYHQLEIVLMNGRSIIFDENQFENYNEVKNAIYRNKSELGAK